MTTQEFATKLVEICKTANFEKTQIELFADDVVSIEPEVHPILQMRCIIG